MIFFLQKIHLASIKTIILFVTLTFFLLTGFAGSTPHNFSQAKKIAKLLFGIENKTLYCSCKYNEKYEVDLHSCNMGSAAPHKRAHRIEFGLNYRNGGMP
jgi:endonuclease I